MANVNFMRGDTEKMDNTAIMDGLIFFNTEENEMFLDDGNTRKQFSGAGHIIENNAGTDMAKRRNMQFKGAYVEDDSENNRTKVNVIRKMTDTEFSQLTEAEKQGIIKTTTDNNLPFDATMVEYDNTQSDLSSTTVQGAIDELNSDIAYKEQKGVFIGNVVTLSSTYQPLAVNNDGYIIACSTNPDTTVILSLTNSDYGTIITATASSTSNWGFNALYVRKGQSVYARVAGSTNGNVRGVAFQ